MTSSSPPRLLHMCGLTDSPFGSKIIVWFLLRNSCLLVAINLFKFEKVYLWSLLWIVSSVELLDVILCIFESDRVNCPSARNERVLPPDKWNSIELKFAFVQK